MRVIGCCTYPTSIPYRRRIEHDAHDFIQAVKGRPLHGYTGVPCRGVRRVVLNTHLDRALEILALLTSDIAESPMPLSAPVLVPIPNGASTLSPPLFIRRLISMMRRNEAQSFLSPASCWSSWW